MQAEPGFNRSRTWTTLSRGPFGILRHRLGRALASVITSTVRASLDLPRGLLGQQVHPDACSSRHECREEDQGGEHETSLEAHPRRAVGQAEEGAIVASVVRQQRLEERVALAARRV